MTAQLPATMEVAVYRSPGEVRIERRPIPTPDPGQVLVEVGHCGICGSDIHMILDGWATPGSVEGHEWSGTVAAVGRAVGRWKVGDAVVGGPARRCGRCRSCREGRPSQCENRGRADGTDAGHDGAFAGYILVDQHGLLALPDGLPPRAGALAEPLAVALHGITRAGLGDHDSVMILGAGPIGALCIAALVARGTPPVAVVEPAEGRRRLALALGAVAVLEPADLELIPQWEPERIAAGAVDVVLECSGRREAMEAGLCQLRRGGRMVLIGAGIEAPTFDPNRVLLNELTVCGSFVYDHDGFDRALEMLGDEGFPIDTLIAPGEVRLDDLVPTMRDLSEGRIAAKAMVVPHFGPGTRIHRPEVSG